jgi:two-component system cell cycle response regulator
MTDNIALLLTVLVAANVILITLAVVRAWRRRRREARFLAARAVMSGDVLHPTAAPRSYGPVVDAPDGPAIASRTDPLTGMLLPREWNRILADEGARVSRYGRTATVVLVELEGLDRMTAILGAAATDRVLPAVADSISRHARGADHVARLGPGRFGILLPETNEVEAVNYVERIRQVCELWLESGAIAMRLAIGWASPVGDASLGDAFNEAEERMYAELRRGVRRAAAVDPEGASGAGATDLGGAPSPA